VSSGKIKNAWQVLWELLDKKGKEMREKERTNGDDSTARRPLTF